MGLSYHTLAITKDGKVMGVGRNQQGQLAVTDYQNKSVPVEILVPNVSKVYTGSIFSYLLLKDGTAKSMGYNNDGQLGNNGAITSGRYGTADLQNVSVSGIKDIATGSYFAFFIMNDGTLKACGDNSFGQLGVGNNTKVTSVRNVPILGVKQIACGGGHTMFLMQDGSVKGVGQNDQGQLGIGNNTHQYTVQNIPITGVKQIACGSLYTMFLMQDGTVKATGNNDAYQLNTGTNISSNSIVNALSVNVKAIYCGAQHNIFWMNDGKIKGQGGNEVGQLGLGDVINKVDPQEINISNVKEISCGANHSVFLLNDGTIKSCGWNQMGQLGVQTGDSSTPVTSAFSNVNSIMDTLTKVTNRFLFQQVDQLKTWLSGNWKNVTGPLTKELFLAEGVASLAGIPPSMLTNGTKVLKWSDDPAASTLSSTIPKSLYDPTNKLYKGIGVVETAKETLTAKPKTLIVNADHTEALLSFSLDNGVSWYTIGNGEVKNINSLNGLELKVRATLPTTTATITALSYAWA